MNKTDWNRKIWAFAGPVILSNISVPLLGAVDTAVVGYLPGPQYMGAVAVGALVFSVLYSGMFFLRMGTTGLTAQSVGARDVGEVRAWLVRAVVLGAAIGGLLIALQRPIWWAGEMIVAPTRDVAELTDAYYSIRIWGAPAALVNFALLGWFFGVQDTRSALIAQFFLNGTNIALDIAFVRGLDMGVEGVAWATLIAEVGAALVGLTLARYRLRRLMKTHAGGAEKNIRGARSEVWNRSALSRMFRVNRDIFVRSMCLQAAFTAFTSIGARMGETTLAANAVLLNFQWIMAYALDGFANAAESFVGEAVGARSRQRFRAVVRATNVWAVGFSLLFSLVYAVFGGLIIDTLSQVSEVRAHAREYLIWSVVLPLVSVWSFQLDGIFTGGIRTAAMRNSMVISLAMYASILPIFVPMWGNHGLWGAFVVFMVARAVTLGVYYPGLSRSVPRSDAP